MARPEWMFALLAALSLPSTRAQVGSKAWDFTADSAIISSPALGSDGAVYFGTTGGRIYALRSTGSERWEYQASGSIQGSPALGNDDTVYCGTMNGRLYALYSGGTLRWTWTAGGAISTTPAIGADGTVYVAGEDKVLTALQPDGALRWQYKADGVFQASPVIGSDGTCYIASRDGRMHAVNPDGTRRWIAAVNPVAEAAAAIGRGGMVCFGTTDNRLRALSREGANLWDVVTDSSPAVTPVIAADGTILTFTSSGRLYAFRPDGTNLWQRTTAVRPGHSSPALGSDGMIYIGGTDGTLTALNADGSPRWAFGTGARISGSSPTLGPDGTVYVGSEDGHLYALRGSAGPATALWPMFQRDARHTASGFVERYLPISYSPGIEFTVTLAAIPPAGVTSYLVEDTPPAGWTVSDISDQGYFDSANRRVRFGPFLDHTARPLTYTVTPPLGDSGLKTFTGSSAANGADRLVGGDGVLPLVPLHPADNRAPDGWLTVREVTAYGAAWKRGTAWPLAPTTIPSAYLTRAVELWQHGEYYQFTTNFLTAPQWWIAAGLAPTNVARPDPLPPGTNAPNGNAVASAPLSYRPGSPLAIAINILPATNVVAQAVEDQPPAGWQVTAVSDGGVFDAFTGKVKWGPFFDATPRMLSYAVVPPANATNSAVFYGVAAFDGSPDEIAGQRQIQPADSEWPDVLVARVLPTGYSPGATLIVSLNTAALGHAGSALLIEDTPPAGWTVGAISDNGQYDATLKLVRFGPFTDGQPRSLRYELTPPGTETQLAQFYGTFTLDSAGGLIVGNSTLPLIPLHPADNQIADSWMTIGELTAYAAVWKKGGTWPALPNPIPPTYVEQAALLWQNGEAYTCDTNRAVAPFYWYPLSPDAAPPTQEPVSVPAGTTVTNGTAVADLPPGATPGSEFTVTLVVTPATNTAVYAFEDRPPTGWMITTVDTEGSVDPLRGKVKWGPYFDGLTRTNSYRVRVPVDATNVVTFAGTAAFDGKRAAFGGLRQVFVQPAATTTIAHRHLPAAYLPGGEMIVTVQVTIPPGTRAYVVEESPPAGWSVGTISDNGAFDSTNRKVKFGPFFDGLSRTLSYELTPPAGSSGVRFFSGTTLADDTLSVVDGDHALDAQIPVHPADLQWADFRISLTELTAYGAAWKRGSAWPIAPTAIPTSYLTRAIQLWQSGEAYGYTATSTNAPDWWIPAPGSAGPPVTVPAGSIAANGAITADMPHFYTNGSPITVTITVTPAASVAVHAVEELIPAGWTIPAAQISAGGFWDATQHKVKWGPFFDATARVLTYQAVPGADATDLATFAGGAAFDGSPEETTGRRLVFRPDGDIARQFTLTLLSWRPGIGTTLQLHGQTGEVYALQGSIDLETWATLAALTNRTGTVTYLDTTSSTLPLRSYRGLWP